MKLSENCPAHVYPNDRTNFLTVASTWPASNYNVQGGSTIHLGRALQSFILSIYGLLRDLTGKAFG
jgi:hypothetical protein